jgi:hypothetical protein
MEVHHHPEVEKKGLKEYILEGLMIFIAVTMGFFAESIRENITNREHAEQLTTQLVTELKSDTAQLREIDSAESKILAQMDTLSLLLKQPMAKADMKSIQKQITRAYSMWPFHSGAGAAINAIKSEIRLKQFSGTKISYYISIYEGRADLLHKIEALENDLKQKVFNAFFSDHFTYDNLSAALNGKPIVNDQMRDLTQNDLVRFNVNLVLIRAYTGEQLNYARRTKKDAITLMDYVKKQYELE